MSAERARLEELVLELATVTAQRNALASLLVDVVGVERLGEVLNAVYPEEPSEAP